MMILFGFVNDFIACGTFRTHLQKLINTKIYKKVTDSFYRLLNNATCHNASKTCPHRYKATEQVFSLNSSKQIPHVALIFRNKSIRNSK